jgi:hypothetical protein
MGHLSKGLLIILLIATISHAKVTPSEVFQEAKAIKIALAQHVVQTKGVSLLPIIDIDLKGATPSSVYALGSALNFKLMILADTKNKPWKAVNFPNTKITPKQVKDLLLVVQQNLQSLLGNVTFERQKAQGKKPADVAQELTFANQWLDKIMPFVKPQYPLAILEKTERFLDLILRNNQINIATANPMLHKSIKPKDVFLNVTATYNLLRNLKLAYAKESSAVHPYNILSATNNIKPLDVYSVSLFNLFYLYSLGTYLNTSNFDSTKPLTLKDKVKPNMVFQKVDVINYKLANIIVQMGGSK